MSNHLLLRNLQTTYLNTGLHFLLMFLGVVIAPVIIFVNNGADFSPQNSANLSWQFLTLGSLLFAALLLGYALFRRKAHSLSFFPSPTTKSAVHHGPI